MDRNWHVSLARLDLTRQQWHRNNKAKKKGFRFAQFMKLRLCCCLGKLPDGGELDKC
jgi:hypothetical protein